MGSVGPAKRSSDVRVDEILLSMQNCDAPEQAVTRSIELVAGEVMPRLGAAAGRRLTDIRDMGSREKEEGQMADKDSETPARRVFEIVNSQRPEGFSGTFLGFRDGKVAVWDVYLDQVTVLNALSVETADIFVQEGANS